LSRWFKSAAPAVDPAHVDILYAVAKGIDDWMNAGPPLVPGLICLLIAAVPVGVLHEWGHAFAATDRLGAAVKVRVGHAGKLAEFRLGEVATSINLLAVPGRIPAVAELDLSRATARDVVWIALAGPLVSAVGLLVAATLYTSAPEHGVLHGLLWAVWFESFYAVLNVIPFSLRERRRGPAFRSDGRIALDALRCASRLKRAQSAAKTG
jgi:peptidase M50-like protein